MNSVASSYHKNLSKNFKKQIEAQAEHYKKLAESNFELRRFRHDYKNINIGVSKLIECGNTTEALEMLNDYNEQIKSTTKSLIKFDTGNGIVDALLTEKQEKATTVNTVITFKGAITSELISPTDLCVIFGNTLDNAIEACEKISLETKKEISINCNCNCGFMFLTISNPVVENISIHNNSIKTSKKDTSNHGFGLYSLKKIIQKYNGEFSLSCNNNLFHAKIELTLF